MRILGLIPARGGSKGIPRKNIRMLCGKPLLQYTIDAALASRRISRVILSTDDEEIASLGRHGGIDVPFLRPTLLALDDTPMIAVVKHAIHYLEQTEDYYDVICLLQPTCPLRSAEDIDACISLMESENADAVATVLPVPLKYNPHWVYFRAENGTLHLSTAEKVPITRRQELPPAYHREGSIYLVRRESVVENDSLYGESLVGYPMDPLRSVNIDDQSDWDRAEQLMRTGCQ